ncbi:hypothetical protein IFR09_04515 [Pseudomonas syringae]|nr:hypothetical protein [Pseudomonas syringae]MBD8574162.1 hypothetical protein [Pseudomonas syringae]MBD8791659.1 hypothetical protein [Pseudomonas syringae]MBD8801019.1 hypothetical protein [Pseudomonas syringae]MBD8810423.1 hypothetical protein [Pseudomonas syringae]
MKASIPGSRATRVTATALSLCSTLADRLLTLIGRGMCVEHKNWLLFSLPGAAGIRIPR